MTNDENKTTLSDEEINQLVSQTVMNPSDNTQPVRDPVAIFLNNKGNKINTASISTVDQTQQDQNSSKIISPEKPDEEKPDEDLNILKERLQENQSYARSIKRSMSDMSKSTEEAIAKINEFLENGDLSEDQSKLLLSILKTKSSSNSIKEPKGLSDNLDNKRTENPFDKFFDTANAEVVAEYKRYSRDKNCEEKIRAFDVYFNEATTEELEKLYHDLSTVENEPADLLIKMLEVGQQFIDEGYSDFSKAGGIRNYLKEKNAENATLKKKIDKLEKEMAKYEMYDQPRNRILESSEGKSLSGQFSEPFDKLVALRRSRG